MAKINIKQIDGWPDLKGAQGFQGSNGVDGAQGSTGAQGAQGFQGSNGVDGAQGVQGPQGSNGVDGAQGVQGPQGSNGVDGAQGVQGPQGSNGVDGAQGVQGPQGSNGVDGAQGVQGPQGSNGVDGAQGVQGPQGSNGVDGAQGVQGFQGSNGVDGAQGATGPQDFSQITENVLPANDGVYNIGSDDKKWYDGHFTNKITIGDIELNNVEQNLTLNSNLKISDDLIVRNNILLQQNQLKLGVVTGFETIPSTSISVTYEGAQLSSEIVFSFGYFYSSYADLYFNSNANQTAIDLFKIGNNIRLYDLFNNVYWDLLIGGIYFTGGSYMQISYSVISASDVNVPYPGYSNYYFNSENTKIVGTLIIPESYNLILDKSTVDISDISKILVNGEKNLPITNIEIKVDSQVTPTGLEYLGTLQYVQFSNNGGGNGYVNMGGNYTVWNDELNNFFAVGKVIRIEDRFNNYYGEGTITSGMFPSIGNNFSSISFYLNNITYNNSNFYIGSMNSPDGYIIGTIQNSYYKLMTDSTVTETNKYNSFKPYNFLSINDLLEYVPLTSSISFKNDDGTDTKVITYNNTTGELTYDGIDQPIIIGNNNTIFSKNAGLVDQPSNNNSPWKTNESVNIGLNANTYGGNGAVSIGTGSNASSQGVGIGYYANATGYSSISIGNGSDTNGNIYAVSIGSSSYNNGGGVGIGYGSNVGGGVSIGSNSYSNTYGGGVIGSNTRVYGNDALQGSGLTIGTVRYGNNGTGGASKTFISYTSGSRNRNSVLASTETGKWYWNTDNYYNPQQSPIGTYNTDIYNLLGNSGNNSVLIIKGTLSMFGLTGWNSSGDGIPSNSNYKIVDIKYIIGKTATSRYTYQWGIINEQITTIASAGDGINWNMGLEIYNNRIINPYSNITAPTTNTHYALRGEITIDSIKF